jgi:hypothetical protein
VLRAAQRPAAWVSDLEELGDGVILGVDCRNGHFNDPRGLYCSCCGISLVHQPHQMRPGRRPPLGVLVFDDGYLYSLDADLVVGSAPGAVASGTRTLRLSDPEGMVAGEHLRIQLRGWDVQVVDLGSSQGSHYAQGGDQAWSRIPANAPMPLRPGTNVLLGWRRFRYESYRTP